MRKSPSINATTGCSIVSDAPHSAHIGQRIDKEVLRQLKNHVDNHLELRKLYNKAMETEFSIRKMILCQWIERVEICSYEHITVSFQDEIEIF